MTVVVPFTGVTRLDVPPSRVIEAAAQENLGQVVIVGWDADGDFYFATSHADGPKTLWLLAMAQKQLLDAGESDE